VVGPELTGKTALARLLADHFNTVYVTEYARIYAIEKTAVQGSAWWPEEFIHIARTQTRLEAEAETMAGDVMICDTDAFSIWVWHRYYAAQPVEALRTFCDARPADLYLLTSEDDALTEDTPVNAVPRDVVLDAYRRELEATGRRYLEVTGTLEERLSKSITATEELLAS